MPLTTERFGGKTAIITGGASGIGRAMGAHLAAEGAHVVLTDLDEEAVRNAATAIGGSTEGHRLDVRDADAVEVLVAGVVSRHGSLDLLFNNAGITVGGPTHELTKAHWDHVIDVNLDGVVNGLLAAYPRMIEQGHGHIVNTASGAGLAAPPFVVPYAATKHAVVGMSLGLRPEAAMHGVRVSVLCPGAVETGILDAPRAAHLPPTASAPVTARAYLAVVGQRPIPADVFAQRALAQVARNRSIIIVPRSAKALWHLQRLSPAAVERVSRSLARRVDRKLIRPADEG